MYPILRALEEAGRIRRGYFVDGLGAAQFALAGALDRLRAVREPSDANPAARDAYVLAAADPANPYGAALSWPRRGDDDRRPLQRAAGAYVVLIDGEAALYLERGGSTLQVLARRRPGRGQAALRPLAMLVADGRFRELVVTKVDGLPVAESPFRAALLDAGFVSRLSRPDAPRLGRARVPRPRLTLDRARRRHAPPDGGRLAAVPRRSNGDRGAHRRAGSGSAGRPHRRPVRSAPVEALGKNLLIRFDGDLELRTHLRMNGSWHRYRPGERWRRPPSRARLVLEVPGAVAVCFDAPVVELFEERAEALHPSWAASVRTCSAPDFDAAEASAGCAHPERRDLPISAALLDQRALAGIGNIWRNETLFAERVDPLTRVADLDDDTLRRIIATARRLLMTSAGLAPERAGPMQVYRRTGRPCRRCGTAIRSDPLRGEIPRTTYWCPTCQAPP